MIDSLGVNTHESLKSLLESTFPKREQRKADKSVPVTDFGNQRKERLY